MIGIMKARQLINKPHAVPLFIRPAVCFAKTIQFIRGAYTCSLSAIFKAVAHDAQARGGKSQAHEPLGHIPF